MLVSYSVIGLRYRAATTKCLLSWNCAGAGVGPRPPLGTGSLDPLESRSRLGLWVQGGMQENIAIAGFGIKVYREGVKPGLPAHSVADPVAGGEGGVGGGEQCAWWRWVM